MMHVFLPYVHSAAKWEELRYALRSWDANADFKYQIVIVGDLPEWCQNVIHIPHTPSYDGKEGEILRDAIIKMRLFLGWARMRNVRQFIRTYDDIFLLQRTKLEDIAIPKAMYDMTTMNPLRNNTWRKQLWNTYLAVRGNNCHGWNMETHTPESFTVDFMSNVMDRYQLPPNQFLTSTLYYNQLFSNSSFKPIVLSKSDKYKAGFYGMDDKYSFGPKENIAEVCARKLFLNFDNAGLTPEMMHFVENHYPKKCRHEI